MKATSLVTELKYLLFVGPWCHPASTCYSRHYAWGRSITTQSAFLHIWPILGNNICRRVDLPQGSHMLEKHLLLQLTATLYTGGVTKGKWHILVIILVARARCCAILWCDGDWTIGNCNTPSKSQVVSALISFVFMFNMMIIYHRPVPNYCEDSEDTEYC